MDRCEKELDSDSVLTTETESKDSSRIKNELLINHSSKVVQVIILITLILVAIDNRNARRDLENFKKSLDERIEIVMGLEEAYKSQEKKLDGRAEWAQSLQEFISFGSRWTYENQVDYARSNNHIMPDFINSGPPQPVLPEEIIEHNSKIRKNKRNYE